RSFHNGGGVGVAVGAAGKPFGFKDSRAVFAAAPANANAAAIVERAANASATAAWTLLHAFLPQRIILGGGIGQGHFDRFAAPMRRQVSRATQIPKNRVEIAK